MVFSATQVHAAVLSTPSAQASTAARVLASALGSLPGPGNPIALPTVAELGFKESHYLTQQGDQGLLLDDLQTGWRIRMTIYRHESRQHDSAERVVEIRDAQDHLVERQEAGSNYSITEKNWPRREKHELRWLRGAAEEALSVWQGGRWVAGKIHALALDAFANSGSGSCAPPIPFEELDRKLKANEALIKLQVEGDTVLDDFVQLGSNVRTTRGCALYGEAGALKLGEYHLAEDFREAMDVGLRCMAGLATWRPKGEIYDPAVLDRDFPPKKKLRDFWRAKAAAILGLFSASASKPFTIKCVRGAEKLPEARALICGDDDSLAPGMVLNISALAKVSRSERLAVLFHESVHQTGLRHTPDDPDDFDAVTKMTECCMSSTYAGKDHPERDFYCAQVISKVHGEPNQKSNSKP